MEKTQAFNVKIVSREAVKPSIPTASHLKNFNLSYIDQMLPLVPPFLTSGLLFYTNTNTSQTLDLPLHITRLKTSLSKTLTMFYPLAGRIKQSTIICDDEGIPFIETQVNCPLSLVLNSPHKLEFATKFLPPRESLGLTGCDDELEHELELFHLAIQVNVFTCGGIAIGWYDIHKITDGTSCTTFFKYWASLANQQWHEGLVSPDFHAAITAFPPSPKAELIKLANGYDNIDDVVHGSGSSPTIVKSFIFRSDSISKIKARASSKQVHNPTRYQALAGFIWEQLRVVSLSKLEHQLHLKHTDTVLQVTVDIRPFTNPPLPRGSIGNLINTAVAKADDSAKLPELVAQIHEAVSKMKDEIRQYHDDKPVDAVRASWDNLINTISYYKERAYKVVSWCKLGYNDLDFGFGKPKWMVPTDGIMSPFHKNLVILTDFTDSNNGDGIEAWFFLEEKHINMLESNPTFLEFASPR